MVTIILIALGYAIGSISGSLMMSKLLSLPDPRSQGSGNAGATNMRRMAGNKIAVIVLLIDLLKGSVAVLIAYTGHASSFTASLVALAAVVGHIYPAYFKFKGGKGVATALGTFIILSPLVGILCIAIWALIAMGLRLSSLSSIIAVTAGPILFLFTGDGDVFIPTLAIALLVIYKHKDNIKRLKTGTENKINF